MKRCTKCGVKELEEDFSKDRRAKDGLRGQCKICDATDYQSNRVERLKYQRGYRQSHSVERTGQQRRYSQSPKGKVSHCRSNRNYCENHPEKVKAIKAVNRAIKSGKLVRSLTCEECGLPAETQGHHEDYSKYLDVNWLCVPCHIELHRGVLDLS